MESFYSVYRVIFYGFFPLFLCRRQFQNNKAKSTTSENSQQSCDTPGSEPPGFSPKNLEGFPSPVKAPPIGMVSITQCATTLDFNVDWDEKMGKSLFVTIPALFKREHHSTNQCCWSTYTPRSPIYQFQRLKPNTSNVKVSRNQQLFGRRLISSWMYRGYWRQGFFWIFEQWKEMRF